MGLQVLFNKESKGSLWPMSDQETTSIICKKPAYGNYIPFTQLPVSKTFSSVFASLRISDLPSGDMEHLINILKSIQGFIQVLLSVRGHQTHPDTCILFGNSRIKDRVGINTGF